MLVNNYAEMFVIGGLSEYIQFHTGQQRAKQPHCVEFLKITRMQIHHKALETAQVLARKTRPILGALPDRGDLF